MANIKSAKKRILVSAKKTERNKAIRSKVRTAVKKVYAAIEANNKADASAALTDAISELDRATKKGVLHRNTSARKISRMTISVNKLV